MTSSTNKQRKLGLAVARSLRPRAMVGDYFIDEASDKDHPEDIPAAKPNWVVLIVSGVFVLGLTAWAFFGAESASTTLGSITSWISHNLGWFYILTATVAVVFVIAIALSRFGSIRLGPDHSRPKYRLFSWAAMLFAAGIGTDLMFFSVAEPVTQYLTPPVGSGETQEAANQAVVYALFHYGLTGWAMYALMGIAFGYFAYRLNMPLAIRSALYPLIGKRVHGRAGDAIDIAAVLGTVFGVAATLGIAVVQLNYGLHLVFGIEEGPVAQSILIIIGVAVATISAVSGVDKGIKRLSELNVLAAFILLAWVVFTGKTSFLFDALVMNVGDYLSSFPSMTMDTYAFTDTPEHTQAWMESWTLFFWAWWVAWAVFVGLFLARISRGRTLREFIFGVLTIPFSFILLWMSFFGNSAIDVIRDGNLAFGEQAAAAPERGFYDLISTYPGASFLVGLATVVGLLLYVTSADSGALVLSNFSSHTTDSRQDGSRGMRIFWSVSVGLLTLTMLQLDGVPTLQSATIIVGLPFAVIMYLIMLSLIKCFRLESFQEEARAIAMHGALSSRSGATAATVDKRLDRLTTWPDEEQANEYITKVAAPALQEIAQRFQSTGFNVTLVRSSVPDCEVDQLDLVSAFGSERDFKFQIYPSLLKVPDFVSTDHDTYVRLEVYDLNGSKGYDIYGYTREQLISNFMDLYERHLEFLHMQRGQGPSDLSDGAEPLRTWDED